KPPALVLQWPEGCEIEDVIGWVANANPSIVVPKLSEALGREFSTVATFIECMKLQPRESGLKGDAIAYEAIIAILADNQACLERMRLLLQRIRGACLSESGEPLGWTRNPNSTEKSTVLRFVL